MGASVASTWIGATSQSALSSRTAQVRQTSFLKPSIVRLIVLDDFHRRLVGSDPV